MTADEILKAITDMENDQRIKLLNKLFDEYFDSRPPLDQIKEEKERMFWGEDEDKRKTRRDMDS